MAPKKLKVRKVQFKDGDNKSEEGKQLALEDIQSERREHTISATETQNTEASEATLTSTESSKKRYGGSRGPAAMYKVVVKKAQGKQFKIRYNELGVPIGSTRHTLQSYIGMLARNMIPIDVPSWPNVDPELKSKLWVDIQATFKVAPESKSMVLKSAGTKWRQFKSQLTADYVMPFIGQKKKLRKPPLKYAFVGKDKWKNFVAQRTDDRWMEVRKIQSERVKKRKYPHRLSRKGYVGLREEEIKKGNLKRKQLPDRAIFWKKARKPKNGEVVDPEQVEMNERIDMLLEQKERGDFVPSGTQDVLTTALKTPEHSGRVRGVGSFVTPKVFFDLPKEKRTRITKAELLARDKQRTEELEKTKQLLLLEISALKELMRTSNIESPLSDKASSQPMHEVNGKPSSAKGLMADDDDQCTAFHHTPPSGKKGPRPCELSVDCIENKVAFGMVFDDAYIHEDSLQPGCVRVLVDGVIQGDALIPVPIPGQMEKVFQVVGSQVAWPLNLISFTSAQKPKVPVWSQKKNEKNMLKTMESMFRNVEISKKVPARFKLLYKHATVMKDSGLSIPIPCDAEVFGFEKVIYILHENIIALLNFGQIGQSAICAYMSYLHTVIRARNDLELYAFVDPAATYNINKDFEAYIVKRLKEGNPDRMFFMPHNQDMHWILVIFWEGDIYILNPLPQKTQYTALQNALSRAIQSFNAETGRGNKPPKVVYVVGSPKQPGGNECGYVVLRYMADLLKDEEMTLIPKWSTKTRLTYTMAELDEVRVTTLEQIEDKM